ncbi:MAG: hypothetical protein C4330_02285 [Chitinophagaceae bacterium]
MYLQVSYFSEVAFFFHKSPRNKSRVRIPSKKTDLHTLSPDEDVIIWFGHSSYFLQIDGKKFLIDPILSGNASPLAFLTKSFEGSDVYDADEIPAIDYLLLSHDHYAL